ncbi:uncharacterized protein LOC125679149 [Ostrea edulis]|uniref:uncharacterized protein LOC125679149 n=1 Tax=Ostrea edulis TaxID=37623 RepID=UPI0024AF08E1|nr:uncharacterized protein LOC125679149 [Ostrea edulis]
MHIQKINHVTVTCPVQTSRDSACTFPDELKGEWHASDLGDIIFHNNTMATKKSTANFGIRKFECTMKVNGNRYFMKSDVFEFYGSPFRLGLCWELQRMSTTQYIYHAALDVLPNTKNARILFRLNQRDFNITRDCQFRSSYDPWQARVLMQQGAMSTTQCPSIIQAKFTYTFDLGDGNLCNANTSLDVCSDTSTMNFDYNSCSAEIGYSAFGELLCVREESYNDLVYLIVYNNDTDTPDEVARFRFTCYVMQQDDVDSRVIHTTQYPQACLDDNIQTSRQVISPGAYLKLNLSSQDFCIGQGTKKGPDSTVSTSAISVIVAVFAVFAVSMAIVSGVKLYKKYKTSTVKPTRSESISSIGSFDRVQSMFSLDGRISPFSLRPTLSEIAYKRFGSTNEDFTYLDDDQDDMYIYDTLNDTKYSIGMEDSHDQSGLIDYEQGKEVLSHL